MALTRRCLDCGCRTNGSRCAGCTLRRERIRNRTPAQQARLAITREQRQRVYQRDGHRCARCGSVHDLMFDHVVPFALMVKSSYRDDELITRCRRFNARRGATTGFGPSSLGEGRGDARPHAKEADHMATARPMLDTYPRDFNVDADPLARCIDECYACAETCTLCADDCLSEQDVASLVKCIRLNLDCADICTAAGRVIARQTEYDANVTRPILEACAQVCKSCGDECERHAEHHEHCRICAEECRRCEQACNELLSAMK